MLVERPAEHPRSRRHRTRPSSITATAVSHDQTWWILVLCWIVAAGLAFLTVKLSDRAAGDRLVGALAAATGSVVTWDFAHSVAPLGIVLVWSICTVLDASVCAELRTRRVPPLLVLPVSLFAVGVDIYNGNLIALAVGAIIGACFAVAWLQSKGSASGLGDAQLAALAGLTLGLELGTIAIAVACLAAAGISFARKRRGAVAFAPYLAATIQAALLFAVLS
jgi:prepilin signal peptidase PulO-like enzyme (type II secretory pathway)